MAEACNHDWEVLTNVNEPNSDNQYFRRCPMCLRTETKDKSLGPREEEEGWVLLMEGPERLQE
jgi:hypothetical protein